MMVRTILPTVNPFRVRRWKCSSTVRLLAGAGVFGLLSLTPVLPAAAALTVDVQPTACHSHGGECSASPQASKRGSASKAAYQAALYATIRQQTSRSPSAGRPFVFRSQATPGQ